jgi:two-component system sensor histidine kinase DesK
MDTAARRRRTIPVRVGPVTAFGVLLVLLVTLGVPLLLGDTTGLRLLYDLAFVAFWYTPLVGIHLAQVHSVSRAPKGSTQYWLLLVQGLVAVPLLLFGGWPWHAVTGLLAASVLVTARASSGLSKVFLLLFAGVFLTLLPLTLLLAYPAGAFRILYWLAVHLTVVGSVLALSHLLVSADRTSGEERAQSTEEPRSLATDLHDILGGTLTAITLKGEIIQRMGSGHPDLEEETRSLVDLARSARSEIRAAAASTWNTTFAAEKERVAALLADAAVDLSADIGPCQLPERVDRVLALILRESVTNALAHSEVNSVDLSLEQVDGWVTLVVGNDGAPHPGEGIVLGTGLRSIAERCGEIGGYTHAGAMSGGRFRVFCRLPI